LVNPANLTLTRALIEIFSSPNVKNTKCWKQKLEITKKIVVKLNN
jgi:hypothetical protein